MRVQIRKTLSVVITPKCNIQFKAVRCSLRLLVITYAFLANERTALCSWRNSHGFETCSIGFVCFAELLGLPRNYWFQL